MKSKAKCLENHNIKPKGHRWENQLPKFVQDRADSKVLDSSAKTRPCKAGWLATPRQLSFLRGEKMRQGQRISGALLTSRGFCSGDCLVGREGTGCSLLLLTGSDSEGR